MKIHVKQISKKSVMLSACVATIAVAAVLAPTLVWLHDWPVHHFGIVQDGVLYRGGQPDVIGLERIMGRYRVKTVVNLRGPSPDEDWWRNEERVCRQHGVRMIDVPVGNEDNVIPGLKQFLALAMDKACRPVFVHCEAGSARTGYVVAAYRIVVQGWNYDQAIGEAAKFRFKREVNLNPEYDRILHELAGGLDWRKLSEATTDAPASSIATNASK